MMTISNNLFQLAGFFEKYRETGGTITAEDAVRISAMLNMLGVGTEALEKAKQAIADEFDRYIEDQCSDDASLVARPRNARAFGSFAVIEGGAA
jgi:hypothetical protein